MSSRNLLQMIEQPINMDGSIAKDFQLIGQATRHIGEQMVTELMTSFSWDAGTILQYLAVVAAIYLFIIDRTNWRTNLLTALLVPYIALNLPDFILQYIRSQIGAWIAFVALVIRLFFPTYIPPHTELPAALILLLVTAPSLLVGFRFAWPGEVISIFIGFYLLYEHIVHAGGFKQAFAERGVVITIGIFLLFVAPVFQLILFL
jgi:membrane-associated HD superfamily phosphohydrolase